MANEKQHTSDGYMVKSTPKVLYHGTAAKDFKSFKGLTYLTSDPKEAEGFAHGVHLGGGTGGTPRVLKVTHPLRKVKNIDSRIMKGMFDEGRTDNDVVREEVKKAHKTGHDAVSFTHPSNYTNGEFTAYVPTNNNDIKHAA